MLEKTDKEVFDLVKEEYKRQVEGLELIASENYTSAAVQEAISSCFTNKYSEGQPAARYYGGNEVVDKLELLCKERALKLFGCEDWHVNVQPYSGSTANFAAFTGLLQPHDRIMGLDLPSGGHLSHGYRTLKKKVSAPAIYFESLGYQLDEDGFIDYDKLQEQVLWFKPKLLICGASAYPRDLRYRLFRKIADSVGALLLADIAHISGLVAAKEHNNPFDYCDVVCTTTHKTLRGPRAGMIFCRKELAKQIDDGVFPACQGGHHNNTIAGVAVALKEAMQPQFKEYIQLVMKNARELADELIARGFELSTGGTGNHLLLLKLRHFGLTGSKMEKYLEYINISVNKNTIQGDKSAVNPSGIRIGTAAITSRGITNMKQIAIYLTTAVKNAIEIQKRHCVKLVDFIAEMKKDEETKVLRKMVIDFSKQYPTPCLSLCENM